MLFKKSPISYQFHAQVFARKNLSVEINYHYLVNIATRI